MVAVDLMLDDVRPFLADLLGVLAGSLEGACCTTVDAARDRSHWRSLLAKRRVHCVSEKCATSGEMFTKNNVLALPTDEDAMNIYVCSRQGTDVCETATWMNMTTHLPTSPSTGV